jgi:protein gp37
MSQGTGIEWTDATWNPVVGCSPVSPGCLNCYAATMARRLEAMGRPEYVGLTVERGGESVSHTLKGRPTVVHRTPRRRVFSGVVRCLEDRLLEPLHWRKPRRVFVCSMADLFHEAVPFEFIDRVFAVMALCPQHTFQVLTKRPERMAEYLRGLTCGDVEVDSVTGLARLGCAAGDMLDGAWIWGEGKRHRKAIENFITDTHDEEYACGACEDDDREPQPIAWPLPNVWLGASAEDQPRLDERVPHLLRCPAAVRFLSCEPLLGPVDLNRVGGPREVRAYGDKIAVIPTLPHGGPESIEDSLFVHWVIVGGESGPNARPCDVDHVRSIVRQCRAAGVPVFVKQLGRWIGGDNSTFPLNGLVHKWLFESGGTFTTPILRSELATGPDYRHERPAGAIAFGVEGGGNVKHGDPAEWPEDLRVREFPEVRA